MKVSEECAREQGGLVRRGEDSLGDILRRDLGCSLGRVVCMLLLVF